MTQTPLKILVPIDITQTLPEMFGLLKEFLPLKTAQITLLYVREEMPAFETLLGTMADFPTDLSNQIEAKARQVLDEQAQLLRADGIEVLTEIVLGPPALMIETVAKDKQVDFIAMTPGKHSKVAQYLIGSTCERVAKHARTSVLILRGEQPEPLRNIVIGIDGSESAQSAMLKAVETFGLATRDVNVTLVNVVSVSGILKYVAPPGFVARIEDNLMMSGEASLAQAEKSLIEAGVKNVSVKLKNGDPETELLRVASDLQAQVIVVGAQGRSALEQVVLGSVSGKIASHASCSTAVVRSFKS